MLDATPNHYWINNNLFDGSDFYGGLVMPETLNWIYYDVIEDIFPIALVSYDELENFYCDIQLSMTGLFAYLLGSIDYSIGLNDKIGYLGIFNKSWVKRVIQFSSRGMRKHCHNLCFSVSVKRYLE